MGGVKGGVNGDVDGGVDGGGWWCEWVGVNGLV